MSDPSRFTPTGVGTIVTTICAPRCGSVHPHGRGDNGGGDARRVGDPRFTPTGVGTIASSFDRGSVWAVHPHGRGDNAVIMAQAMSDAGSPPRAWGQFGLFALRIKPSRFTPTGVGTIPAGAGRITFCAVHPHGRGDNVRSRVITRDVIGSPPRAWGQ